MNNEIVTQKKSSYLGSIAGELGERSRRIYENDATIFADWLQEHHVTPETIDRQVITNYRAWLVEKYRTATAKRMFSVARRILEEQVQKGVLPTNYAKGVRGIKAEDESPHIALTKEQANNLLATIDTSTKKGKRDYALIMCLLYTGIRRFECAHLRLGDMGMAQGHHILTIQGKGNRRDVVKLRVEAWRAIDEYLGETERNALPGTAPLFCQFRKGDFAVEHPISPMVVYRTIIQYAKESGLDAHLTPHGMRASFVTLSLEGGAKLEQVQVAARHKDPRTTERYWRRKNKLDDNAVDYIKLG